MEQHTKEPWSCRGEYVQIQDEFGGRDCFVGTEANARRIVACVNACAWISTENLEDDCFSKMREDRDMLMKQRDELLEALEEILEFIDYVGETKDPSVKLARAAIASVKGDA